MKKIITVIGARPQFVKASVVSRALLKEASITEIIVHTGQHYDANMSQIFFDELDIPRAHFQLGIGSGSQGKQTGEMLIAIEQLLLQEKPDLLLIYGDTNSTLAGALAAAKLHIPIAHIEAGLRSYNRKMPEEVNRIIADQLSSVLFTPTSQAMKNLKLEGYPSEKIIEVGDVMYDAALFYSQKAMQKSDILSRLHYHPNNYILVTIHRAENTDNPCRLRTIFDALERLNQSHSILMPLHPRTRNLIKNQFPELLENVTIHIIEPVGFLDMLMLEKNAALIMTDSGGVQKEAFFYQVPCVTLREETEWIETVELGWNRLVKPHHVDEIYNQTIQTLGSQGVHDHHPFGKGNASNLIAQHLSQGV
jgi:UDP-GlcNAc3NAcA epimerase